MYKELEFHKLEFQVPFRAKLEFQKSGRLQNIYQTMVKHYMFCQIVVCGHFGQFLLPLFIHTSFK